MDGWMDGEIGILASLFTIDQKKSESHGKCRRETPRRSGSYRTHVPKLS